MGKRSREKWERRNQNNSLGNPEGRGSKLERVCFLIVEWGIYLALFTPLIFIRDYFFPFIVPKTVFFRIIVDIIFIPYVLLAISNPRYRPKLNILTASLAVFLGIAVFTSITGINFMRSFWSVFERMTGLLTFFHLFAFYIILTSCFKERKHWERFFVFSILVGIFIVFYAWTSKEASTRGGSTIGNTSFMSAYLLFDIFFAIMLFFTKNIWWKVFSFVALTILLAGIFISIEPTRGAIGALFIALLLLGFNYLMFYLFSSGKRKLKGLAFLIIAFLILGGIGTLQLNFVKEKITGEFYSTSLQSRMIVWKMALKGWQERFWFGWGQENFYIPFVKYFDPALPLSGDIWYDRAHNIIFDTVVASGLLGLLSYLAIFGVAIFGLLRICSKVIGRKNLLFPLGMISLLVAYFIQNIWVFDMISSYMMFFFSLSFIYFLISPETQTPETNFVPPQKRINPISAFLGGLLIVLAVLTIYFGNIQPAQASRFTIRGLVFPLEQSIPYFQKALVISPISQFETPEQFGLRMTELANQPVKDIELLQQGIKLAEEELKKNIARDPLNFRAYLFLGRYYNNVFQLFGGEERLVLAEDVLLKSIQLSPGNQQAYWTLGQIRLFQGRREEAIEFLKKGVDLEPRYGVSHWYLAMAYKIAGQYEEAAAELAEADKLGQKFKNNLEDLKKAIGVYVALGDNASLLPLLEKAVELSPKDYQLWANLADVYAVLGEREKAKIAAEKVLELAPEQAEQIKSFLEDLGY